MSELSHRQAYELIQGEHISVQERDALATHLTRCETCRRYLAMHLHLSQNLQLEPVRTWPTPELRTALRHRVHNKHRRDQIMKPIQVLAGVAAVIILIAGGWLLFGTSSQAEPAVSQVEATIAATEEIIAVAEPEMPTEAPPIPPTKTAVPPTHTPVPATPTATVTPAPANITTVEELVGYWQGNPLTSEREGNIFRFRADGVLEIADSLAAFEAGEVKGRADFWFEDGLWYSQLTGGIWHESGSCTSGTGKPATGNYEIRSDDAGNIQFIRINDRCFQRGSLARQPSLTFVEVENVDWLTDPETGFPLNPSEFPADSQFVLVGTMLILDASDPAAPVATLRLPSGQVVDLSAPPLVDIIIDGDDATDLSAYDPDYPLRARLLAQLQDDGSLQGIEMLVLTTLK